MWDIPAVAMQLPEGTMSFSGALAGAKQTNKYLSSCPSGNDTYAFTVYALMRRVLLPYLPDDPRRRRRRAYTTGGLSPISRA